MSDETSNTGHNSPRRGQFVRGDPRINRKGRPRSFDELRKLAVLVAAETDEAGITRALEILRDWAKSKEVVKQDRFMAYAYGKPKDEVEHSGELVTKVIIEYSDDKTTDLTPGPEAGQTIPPEV
jgi:hypothetical protein